MSDAEATIASVNVRIDAFVAAPNVTCGPTYA